MDCRSVSRTADWTRRSGLIERDAVLFALAEDRAASLIEIARDLPRVRDATAVDDALVRMVYRRERLVLVIDEHGSTVGGRSLDGIVELMVRGAEPGRSRPRTAVMATRSRVDTGNRRTPDSGASPNATRPVVAAPPWMAPSVTRPQRRAGSARTIDGGMDSPVLIVVRLPAYSTALTAARI
jgi:hypothetical protein